MIEQLFGSKTRVKLLQLFCGNPNRAFYVREITRKIDEQINSVRRELANLLSIGIISSDNQNNRLYYEVNQDYQHYKALAAMFGGGKVGLESEELPSDTNDQVQTIKALGNVELALLTGQFTRDVTAEIDFLLVGDVNQTKLAKFVEDLEKQEGKEIRYAVLTPNDFQYRRQVNDRFLSLVMDAKKQVLIDKHDMFGAVPAKPKTKPKNKE